MKYKEMNFMLPERLRKLKDVILLNIDVMLNLELVNNAETNLSWIISDELRYKL